MADTQIDFQPLDFQPLNVPQAHPNDPSKLPKVTPPAQDGTATWQRNFGHARTQATERPAEYLQDTAAHIVPDGLAFAKSLLSGAWDTTRTLAGAAAEIGDATGNAIRETVGLTPYYHPADNVSALAAVPFAVADHYRGYLDGEERARRFRDAPVSTIADLVPVAQAGKSLARVAAKVKPGTAALAAAGFNAGGPGGVMKAMASRHLVTDLIDRVLHRGSKAAAAAVADTPHVPTAEGYTQYGANAPAATTVDDLIAAARGGEQAVPGGGRIAYATPDPVPAPDDWLGSLADHARATYAADSAGPSVLDLGRTRGGGPVVTPPRPPAPNAGGRLASPNAPPTMEDALADMLRANSGPEAVEALPTRTQGGAGGSTRPPSARVQAVMDAQTERVTGAPADSAIQQQRNADAAVAAAQKTAAAEAAARAAADKAAADVQLQHDLRDAMRQNTEAMRARGPQGAGVPEPSAVSPSPEVAPAPSAPPSPVPPPAPAPPLPPDALIERATRPDFFRDDVAPGPLVDKKANLLRPDESYRGLVQELANALNPENPPRITRVKAPIAPDGRSELARALRQRNHIGAAVNRYAMPHGVTKLTPEIDAELNAELLKRATATTPPPTKTPPKTKTKTTPK